MGLMVFLLVCPLHCKGRQFLGVYCKSDQGEVYLLDLFLDAAHVP